MITDEQRAQLLAAINRQALNPPMPRLSDTDVELIRRLVEADQEDDAWRELNDKWTAAFARAHAAITQQSAEIASAIELQKMARRTQGAMNTLFQVRTKASATSVAAEKQTFRPRVGWQVALFDAWPEICKNLGKMPTAGEGVIWLEQNDTSGCIKQSESGTGLCWQAPDGAMKVVDLKTVETVIAAWTNAGILPS